MWKALGAILGCAFVWLVWSSVTKAETLSVSTEEQSTINFIGGVITGSKDRLQAVMEENPTIKRIAFYSQGGNLNEGIEIGYLLSDNGITAVVLKGTYCLSSCANAFLGAKEYEVEGILGFHSAWFVPSSRGLDFQSIFKQGQYVGIAIMQYYIANGFNIQFSLMLPRYTDPMNLIVFTDTKELMSFYVRNDDGPDELKNYYKNSFHGEEWFEQHTWSAKSITDYIFRQGTD